MKAIVGNHYQDRRCPHNVIMHVQATRGKLAWGDIYYVDSDEPCASLDCGISANRLIKPRHPGHVDIAKEMALQFDEWRKDS